MRLRRFIILFSFLILCYINTSEACLQECLQDVKRPPTIKNINIPHICEGVFTVFGVCFCGYKAINIFIDKDYSYQKIFSLVAYLFCVGGGFFALLGFLKSNPSSTLVYTGITLLLISAVLFLVPFISDIKNKRGDIILTTLYYCSIIISSLLLCCLFHMQGGHL